MCHVHAEFILSCYVGKSASRTSELANSRFWLGFGVSSFTFVNEFIFVVWIRSKIFLLGSFKHHFSFLLNDYNNCSIYKYYITYNTYIAKIIT